MVCAWTRQEAEEQAWLQVREWALGDCRLGSGFHFLSSELQIGSCTPCQMLHSTDNFVSSFYVLEAFSLCYWYFRRHTLSYFGLVSKCLYCSSDVHLTEICCLPKASLVPCILLFSLPAQPDADRRYQNWGIRWVRENTSFASSCLSLRWILVAHCSSTPGIIQVLSQYLQLKAWSCKRSKWWPLVARVSGTQSLNVSVCANVTGAWL